MPRGPARGTVAPGGCVPGIHQGVHQPPLPPQAQPRPLLDAGAQARLADEPEAQRGIDGVLDLAPPEVEQWRVENQPLGTQRGDTVTAHDVANPERHPRRANGVRRDDAPPAARHEQLDAGTSIEAIQHVQARGAAAGGDAVGSEIGDRCAHGAGPGERRSSDHERADAEPYQHPAAYPAVARRLRDAEFVELSCGHHRVGDGGELGHRRQSIEHPITMTDAASTATVVRPAVPTADHSPGQRCATVPVPPNPVVPASDDVGRFGPPDEPKPAHVGPASRCGADRGGRCRRRRLRRSLATTEVPHRPARRVDSVPRWARAAPRGPRRDAGRHPAVSGSASVKRSACGCGRPSGVRPRCSKAAGIATRPRGVRAIMPCWMRNGS